jgi:hypothetical protein
MNHLPAVWPNALRFATSRLSAWRYRRTQGESIIGPDAAKGGSQYRVVTSERMIRNGEILPEMSYAFAIPMMVRSRRSAV